MPFIKVEDFSGIVPRTGPTQIEAIKPSAGDKILEIGCGWGGFAEYLGKNYNVKLDCITISQKQFEFAKQRIHNCGLNEKVNIEIKDYRE